MTRYEAIDWYDEADAYDIVFDADTAKEAAFLDEVFAKYAPSRTRRLLEPACGSARLLAALAREGWKVTGFDASESMLRYGRRRLREAGVRGRLFHGWMQDFDVPPGSFDGAFCLVSTFKYLLTEEDARRHLELIARALVPGGIYILGLHLTDYRDRGAGLERWVGTRGSRRVICTIAGCPPDTRARRERVYSRLRILERGREVRRFETHWTFRTYGAGQLRRLLKSVPELELAATFDFDLNAGKPARFGGDRLDHVLVLRRVDERTATQAVKGTGQVRRHRQTRPARSAKVS